MPSQLARLVLSGLIVGALFSPLPSRAAQRFVRSDVCALVTAQVVCYEARQSTPHPVTPPDQRVLDFAIAPDGNWLAYRSNDTITLTSIDDDSISQQVDPNAAPPAALTLPLSTLAWSPDGLALAYVTASGFRVAFPTADGTPRFVDITDRLVVNLRFSPTGQRLAAQADDNTWTLFSIQADGEAGAVRRTRTIDQAADVAWLDDNSLIAAAISGGLARVTAADPSEALTWTMPGDHFTKLISTSSGDVLALHPDPGETIGHVVRIHADGTVTNVGTSKIDSQAEWGPDGTTLYYITSGTPILIDRATGNENTLPLKRVTRLAWPPPLPPLASSIPMDGDLYFTAPDTGGIRQVWRLPRSGLEPITALTHQAANVESFALSPDRSQVAVVVGSQVGLESPTAPAGFRPLANLNRGQGGEVAWEPNRQRIAFTDGNNVYVVATDGNSIPVQIPLPSGDKNPIMRYHHPQFSPDGRYLMVDQEQNHVLIDLNNGRSAALTTNAPWQPDNVLLERALPNFTQTWRIDAARVAADHSILLLRRVGWKAGPDVVQLYSLAPGSSQATPRSRLNVLTARWLSPTGRFAAGLQRVGTMDQLVIVELQSGRAVRIQGATAVESLEWVS
jgi:WD40 repeat protein